MKLTTVLTFNDGTKFIVLLLLQQILLEVQGSIPGPDKNFSLEILMMPLKYKINFIIALNFLLFFPNPRITISNINIMK